jgi:hypothetical protein
MKHQQQTERKEQAHTVKWLEQCRGVAKRKVAALLQNDLKALEECLDEEAQLLSRRPIFQKRDSTIPRALLLDLRSINKTSRALITNGLDLTRTLLDTIHPPATYSITSQQNSPTGTIAPVISVKG